MSKENFKEKFDWSNLLKFYDGFISNIQKSRILIIYIDPETKKLHEIRKTPLYRFTEEYRQKTAEKLEVLDGVLSKYYKGTKTTMITLTGKHNKNTTNPLSFIKKLQKNKLKLIDLLRKDFKKLQKAHRISKNEQLTYFWVFEPHKSGYAHIHIMVFNQIPEDCLKQLKVKYKKIWSQKYQVGSYNYGVNFSTKTVKIGSYTKYLMKYLRKSIINENREEYIKKFQAVLFFSGLKIKEFGKSSEIIRLYGMSKNLQTLVKEELDKKKRRTTIKIIHHIAIYSEYNEDSFNIPERIIGNPFFNEELFINRFERYRQYYELLNEAGIKITCEF